MMDSRKPVLFLTGTLLLSAPLPASAKIMGDFNGDMHVDAADTELFLGQLAAGNPPAINFDMNSNGRVDLADGLLFGQWVNGLWQNPAKGFPALYFQNPLDAGLFARYGESKEQEKGLTAEALQQRYPESSAAPPAYDTATLDFRERVIPAFAQRAGYGALPTDPAFSGPAFLARVAQDGMAVAERVEFDNYYQALDWIYNKDLPLLFTTDALLHTVYLSYDSLLKQLEVERFIPALDRLLQAAHARALSAHPESDARRDVTDLLSAAQMLLNPSRSNLTLSSEGSKAMEAALSEKAANISWCGLSKKVDFTQFQPRGHYKGDPKLEAYFRAMMWLSRVDLGFELRSRKDTENYKAAHRRMKQASWILWDALIGSGEYAAWLAMNQKLEYLVGQSDGLTPKGLSFAARMLGVSDAAAFASNFTVEAETAFDAFLDSTQLGAQAILSEVVFINPGDTAVDLAPVMNFMPQRFVLDAFSFSQWVHPYSQSRLLPSTLDLAFALGDNSALTDMKVTEFGPMAPPQMLAAQRTLYDGIIGWQDNLYSSWLNFLRKLSPNPNTPLTSASPVFRTAAWNRKMRNTQLASWAQLRHNTILYAKQSYTPGIICEFPRATVEPYPAFFSAVAEYARGGQKAFSDGSTRVLDYFRTLENASLKLAEIASLTAQGQDPTEAQTAWLQSALTSTPPDGVCGSARVYDGWFPSLIYGTVKDRMEEARDFTIADVHSKPQDDDGPALVLHAATGRVQLLAAAVQLQDCRSLFVGPVSSYYESVEQGDSFIRRNDQEWEESLENREPIAKRPDWTAKFLHR